MKHIEADVNRAPPLFFRRRLDMKKSIKDYVSEYEEQLNLPLINKSIDNSLVEYIIDAWKSLEVVDNIRCVSFEYSEKESDIDINKFIFKREKSKKKKYDYKFINDDRCGKLTVKLEISILEEDHKTKEKKVHVYPLKKEMLIPLQNEDWYFYIRGKKYYMIYQLLEKSTYTGASTLTLKSLMPVVVKRHIVDADSVTVDNLTNEKLIKNNIEAQDMVGKSYKLPVYYVSVFNKDIPVILFYLSKGLDDALDFLDVFSIVSFIPNMPDKFDPDNVYFALSSKCYMKIRKEIFEKYPYVQSIAGAFLTVCTNRVTIEQLYDPKIWIKKIVTPNNYEKGKDTLRFFNRLLDQTTKKILKIHPYHRENIYTVLRWMMQEYNELRLKDNLDLKTKRIRCNEYIASLLTKEFSKRLNRIISLRNKATIENYRDLFKFPGDILIQKMHTSGILRFDESVNDMNFFSKLKYTVKGPHSLGGKNSNNINMKQRGIHPSYLGYIDILVCSNSDPGLSGLISPFNDMKGQYFDDSNEPDNFAYLLSKDLEEICQKEGVMYIKIDTDDEHKYYDILQTMDKYSSDNIKVSGTSREGFYEVVLEDENNKISAEDEDSENEDEEDLDDLDDDTDDE